MKKLNANKLTEIKGGGCYKYLRRMDRALRRGQDEAATDLFREYGACMAAR